jgi:hypothetical protein
MADGVGLRIVWAAGGIMEVGVFDGVYVDVVRACEINEEEDVTEVELEAVEVGVGAGVGIDGDPLAVASPVTVPSVDGTAMLLGRAEDTGTPPLASGGVDTRLAGAMVTVIVRKVSATAPDIPRQTLYIAVAFPNS